MRDFFAIKRNSKAIILIIVLVSAVYAVSLVNKFILDDVITVTKNDFIKTWDNFPLIFNKAYLSSEPELVHFRVFGRGSGEISYRPIVTITYFIDYFFWKLNPFGYHFTNLFLHIFNVILLYFFMNLIVKNKKIALITSLLFALHPVNANTVNAISFREDLLMFLFFISSLIMFIKVDFCKGVKSTFFYIISVVLFFLSLLSKEMAVTLPIILVLYDYFFVFNDKPKKIITSFKSRYSGYLVAMLLYFWIRFFLINNNNNLGFKALIANFYLKLPIMFRVFVEYIKRLLLPIDAYHIWGLPPNMISGSFFEPAVLIAVAIIIGCFVVAMRTYKKRKLISFAFFWFFITLLPVSNIFPIVSLMANRYLYLPSIGFCFLITVGLFELPKMGNSVVTPRFLQKFSKNLIIVLLVFYSMFAVTRSIIWRNNFTFWSEQVEHYPERGVARSMLGGCFWKMGFRDKAIEYQKVALTLEPDNLNARFKLATYYLGIGELEQSEREFRKVIEANRYYIRAYRGLGLLFVTKKLYPQAISYFDKAIQIHPDYIDALNNKGHAFFKMGNIEAAEKVWKRVLEIKPYDKYAQEKLKELKVLD